MRLLDPRREQAAVRVLLWGAALLTVAVLVAIIAFILHHGLPVVTPRFLLRNPSDMGRTGGIFSTIVGTLALTAVAIVVAAPIGVGTAIYLTEYTGETRVTRVIRFGAETLAGIPSIIYGLFGFIFFVTRLKLGWSILSGGLTLAIMILPTIVRTSEEAIRSVPRDYRRVGLSLGGTKWQTVTRIVLPSAVPGIVTGIILSIGRSIGETAAVIFTAGSALRLPTSLLSSSRTMSVHFYILAREGISMENAYGTAAVLVLAILAVNVVTYAIMGKVIRKYS